MIIENLLLRGAVKRIKGERGIYWASSLKTLVSSKQKQWEGNTSPDASYCSTTLNDKNRD
jgi:hypothetical protein